MVRRQQVADRAVRPKLRSSGHLKFQRHIVAVLGRNRQGASCGGSGWGCRRGAGGGHALVPAMWRHATVRSAAAFGQVPVVF